MKSIEEILKDKARGTGMCREGLSKIATGDKAEMVDYYLSIPDWCLERDFPDLQTLTELFADCESKGLYVNKKFNGEVLDDLQTYVFHNCSGEIKVGLNIDKGRIPMLYFANGCRMHITGCNQGYSPPIKVPLYLFGDNEVTLNKNCGINFVEYRSRLT